jgi:hypothetical protein
MLLLPDLLPLQLPLPVPALLNLLVVESLCCSL